MERKANRRIDTLLSMLLKIARDKAFERLIKVEKQTHSKKLSEINKRHIVLLELLPPITDGGWFVPSESVTGQQYFIVPASDSCSCSLHCSSCNCCPHMYQCSCVDFAVHATVCKHVHTVHELRGRDGTADLALANVPLAESPSVSQVDDSEPTADLMVLQQVEDTPAHPNDNKSIINRVLASCRQVMAMASSGTYTREVLSAVEKHVNAAKATMRVATTSRPARLAVTRKMPSNRKLDKQLRFRSVRVKRRPLQTTIKKPNATQIAAVKQALMAKSPGATVCPATRHNSMLFNGMNCGEDEIPYCVDCEDV